MDLAAAMAECAGPATAYGKCMDLNLEKVTRGTCEAEFAAFKNCMQQAVRATFGHVRAAGLGGLTRPDARGGAVVHAL